MQNPKLADLYRGSLVRITAKYEGDDEAKARWFEDSDFARNVDTEIAFPYSVDELEPYSKRSATGYPFIVRLLDDDAPIGFVSLHNIEWNNGAASMAIGFGLPQHRGKGYGADTMALILQYAFRELNLYRVGLDYIDFNEKGRRLYEKMGFVEEGRLRQFVHRDGKRYDRVMMGLFRSEWEALQSTI